MTTYEQAKLIPLEADTDTQEEVVGDAIVILSRGSMGEAELTGTFRAHDPVRVSRYGVPVPYTYKGTAAEGSRQCKVEAPVTIIHHKNGLHELTSTGEPQVLEWLD